MPTELQDALGWVLVIENDIRATTEKKPGEATVKMFNVIVEWARRAATPDIKAAANVLEVHLPEAIQPYALRMAQDVIDAALSIPEDTPATTSAPISTELADITEDE